MVILRANVSVSIERAHRVAFNKGSRRPRIAVYKIDNIHESEPGSEREGGSRIHDDKHAIASKHQ